jgi:hypothetical protein
LKTYIYHLKEKAEALSVTIKEVGLEENAQKTVYMFMSHNQNTEQNHNVKTATKSSGIWRS